MKTEFHFNTRLRDDTPKEVIDVLNFMIGKTDEEPVKPSHNLFMNDSWDFMLRNDDHIFPMISSSDLVYDGPSRGYRLSVRTAVRNYDREIEKFLDWIMPYVDMVNGNFLGFTRAEDQYETPTLIHVPESPWYPLA